MSKANYIPGRVGGSFSFAISIWSPAHGILTILLLTEMFPTCKERSHVSRPPITSDFPPGYIRWANLHFIVGPWVACARDRYGSWLGWWLRPRSPHPTPTWRPKAGSPETHSETAHAGGRSRGGDRFISILYDLIRKGRPFCIRYNGIFSLNDRLM